MQRYNKRPVEPRKQLFSVESPFTDKGIRVGFDAPDTSSDGGLLLMDWSSDCFIRRFAALIPDHRNQDLIVHSYAEILCHRVDQIMCGYKDVNDCDRFFLHAAAYVMAFDIKHGPFKGTQAEDFNMDSLIRNIMLSNVHIVERQIILVFSEIFDKNICVIHTHAICCHWINDLKKILADAKGLLKSIDAKT